MQGPFATARFNAPTCLVPSTSKPGMAFLCDTGNNAVRVIFMETGACVWGWGWVSGQFFAECKTIGALSPAPVVPTVPTSLRMILFACVARDGTLLSACHQAMCPTPTWGPSWGRGPSCQPSLGAFAPCLLPGTATSFTSSIS